MLARSLFQLGLLIFSLPALGQWQNLEQRVTVLEAKVKELQKPEPQKLIESTCRLSTSNCVVYKNSSRYGFWYKYSAQLRDTVAFVYPDKTTKSNSQRSVFMDSFTDGEYYDSTAQSMSACQNALSLFTAAYLPCSN